MLLEVITLILGKNAMIYVSRHPSLAQASNVSCIWLRRIFAILFAVALGEPVLGCTSAVKVVVAFIRHNQMQDTFDAAPMIDVGLHKSSRSYLKLR